LASNSKKKKIVIAYWSSRNLGVLDNIINSFKEADFEVKELQFNYLQDLSLNKHLHVKSNTNVLNLFYLILLGLKLNVYLLFNKNNYLFGTNIPLFCPIFIKRKKLVCHYNEVPKFFENSDSIFSKYEKALFKSALNIVVSNNFRRDLFETVNSKASYYILDNILAFKYYNENKNEYREAGMPVKLLYSGIISKNREIIEIIQAVKKNSDFTLSLIGGVESSYSEQFFNVIKDADNIFFLGTVSFEMALKLTGETDFGIAVYNLADNNNRLCAPVKIHEYFLYRKPVISLENPPLLEIAKEYSIIFPLKSINDLQQSQTAEKFKNMKLSPIHFKNFEDKSLNEFNISIQNLIRTVFPDHAKYI
jgi:hypothetical protein